MKRLNALLQRQPWAFLIHGLAVGGSLYLVGWLAIVPNIGVGAAIVGGLVSASVASVGLAIRKGRREARERISAAGRFRSLSDG
jgi:hypothetical protein